MLVRLFLLLTVVPLTELTILLRIGGWLGWLPTLGLVIATGAIGALLARREGLKTLARIHQELARGEMPTASLADGALILIAGILLITPGVLTDFCGFALLIPGARSRIRRRLMAAWRDRIILHAGSFPGTVPMNGDDFIDVAATSRPVEDETAVEGKARDPSCSAASSVSRLTGP